MKNKMKNLKYTLILLLSFNALSFSQIVNGTDKFLGAGSGNYIFRDFDDFWNQLTPGNAGKWGSVEYTRGNYYWNDLDQLYYYSNSRDVMFKEHTLVWGSQQPNWIGSLDSAAQREAVEDWMRNIGNRYSNTKFVDVVNEPLHAPPDYKNCLGGDGETGWDWVITSFQLARQYMPDSTKLLINEYNILHDISSTSNYLEIINLLKADSLIDGIGIQGHYFEFRGDIYNGSSYVYSLATIKSNLDRLAATGLPIYITEFDIDESDDQDQLDQYQIYFPIFWNHPSVKGITFWGYIEGDVWDSHPYTYLLYSDGSERPALTWLKNYVNFPEIPILSKPTINDTTSLTPTIEWNISDMAEEYRVQVSKYRNFSPLLIDVTTTDTSIILDSLELATRYYWRVKSINESGESEFSAFNYFVTIEEIVGVEKPIMLLNKIELYQNYPNPFNPETNIKFTLPNADNVILEVYDMLGKKIATLIDEQKSSGNYTITWDASEISSGTYFYFLKVGSYTEIKKMTLIK
jgi:endo-1,4-beta-xylanase